MATTKAQKATKAKAAEVPLCTWARLPDGRWRITAHDGSTSTLTRQETAVTDARCRRDGVDVARLLVSDVQAWLYLNRLARLSGVTWQQAARVLGVVRSGRALRGLPAGLRRGLLSEPLR